MMENLKTAIHGVAGVWRRGVGWQGSGCRFNIFDHISYYHVTDITGLFSHKMFLYNFSLHQQPSPSFLELDA